MSWRQVLAGLLTGLAVGLVLTALLIGAGHGRLDRLADQQRAVMTTAAAGDVLASGRADGRSAQDLVTEMAASLPGLDEARVVDIGARSLEASTHVADGEGGAPPRRLNRDEKALYDQARALQAARRTNSQEEVPRKAEILADWLPDGRLELVLPILDGDKVTGSLQAWHAVATGKESRGGRWWPWFVAAVCTAAFLATTRFVAQGRLLFMAAAVILAAGLYIHGDRAIDGLVTHRLELEEQLRDHALTVQHALPTELAAAAEPATWDLNAFRQPRGWFAADGTIDPDGIRADYGTTTRRFGLTSAALGALALVLFGWVGAGWAARTWAALREHNSAYGFILPAMVGMVLLVFFPFAYGVLLSFTGQTLYNVTEPLYDLWVGLDNYVQILKDVDVFTIAEDGSRIINFQSFYWTLGFTLLWTVSNVTIGVSLGLALALILNTKGLAFKAAYRVLLILPWAVPNYITALIWKGMFHRQFGVINQMIQIFGGEPLAWFDGWGTSFLAVLMTNAWLSFPFMMVVSLGALQSIPGDLYEAARVDGAGKWHQFRYVTLPSLKPALVPAVILSVVWTFNMFNIIYLVSQGEPAGATEILITKAYKIAFEQYRYGYAAAYSVVIFIILLGYGVWQNRTTKATEGI